MRTRPVARCVQDSHKWPQIGADGAILIGPATNQQGTIEFLFTSTWPPCTSYQPQFFNTLGNSWANIPDATVNPVTTEGTFLVTATKFGGNGGFFRVTTSLSEMHGYGRALRAR